MVNTNNERAANGVNERATKLTQLSPGNGTVVDQAGRGRHPTTGTTSRRKCTKGDNRTVRKCYYQSNSENIG